MSASSSSSPDESDQLLLRWSEDPNLPAHEESVQMLEARAAEYIIRSSFRVIEKTRVYLIGKDYSEAGIVRSCRKQDFGFILTIGISPEGPLPPHFDIDPGVFIVDSFLTEDQERQILSELEDELLCHDDNASALSVQHSGTFCYDGAAALQRLLKTTARSSTSLVSSGVGHVLGRFRQMTGTCVPALGRTEPVAVRSTTAVTVPEPLSPTVV